MKYFKVSQGKLLFGILSLLIISVKANMQLKLIIFDLDGTLVDSSVDITHAINYAIQPYGLKPITVQETITLVGEGVTRLMEKLIEKEAREMGRALNVDKDALISRFVDYYTAHLVDYTTAYPGVQPTLEQLGSYKKAVISNKREALSAGILQRLDLTKYFDIIVGSDTTPERKPSPVPILHVLSRLNVAAHEAVIVGDSNYDIEAGKAAGIKAVAVTYGYKPLDFLKGADFIIKDMAQLPELIRKIEGQSQTTGSGEIGS